MNKENQTLQTVDRTLALLEMLAASSEPMTINDISASLGTSRTATYAMLNSLISKNFIEKDPVAKTYTLGYKMLELGSRYKYQYSFITACERGIYSLARKCKNQINLNIYKRPGVCILLLVKTPEEYQRIPHVALPAYITAGGKLLLSALDDEELIPLIDQTELKSYAKNTITDKEQLLAELVEIRKNGYAVEREENHDGRCCIACPIRNSLGKIIASVSMVIPVESFERDFDSLLNDIKATSLEISQEIGFNPYA